MSVMPTCTSSCRPCFRVICHLVIFVFGVDFGVVTGDLFDTMVHVFGVESEARSPGVATLCPGRTAFTAGLRQNSNPKTWTYWWSIPCLATQVPPSLRQKGTKTWPGSYAWASWDSCVRSDPSGHNGSTRPKPVGHAVPGYEVARYV